MSAIARSHPASRLCAIPGTCPPSAVNSFPTSSRSGAVSTRLRAGVSGYLPPEQPAAPPQRAGREIAQFHPEHIVDPDAGPDLRKSSTFTANDSCPPPDTPR